MGEFAFSHLFVGLFGIAAKERDYRLVWFFSNQKKMREYLLFPSPQTYEAHLGLLFNYI